MLKLEVILQIQFTAHDTKTTILFHFIDSDGLSTLKWKTDKTKIIFYVLLDHCPNNASYLWTEITKSFFSLSPSRIDFIGHADWTCQVKHPVIKKNIHRNT
jgi:hypothetical protein